MFSPNFSLDQAVEARDHLSEHGYVVIRNVLSAQECQATTDEINALLQAREPSFDITNINTYERTPIDNRYGVIGKDPLFTPRLLANRCHPHVYQAFQLLYQEDALVANHDRVAFYRPTSSLSLGNSAPQDRLDWRTPYTYPGLHLDFNPNVYDQQTRVHSFREGLTYSDLHDFIRENNAYCRNDGLQLQGVLNLWDNYREDGGYQCAPSFDFESWLQGHRSDDLSPAGIYTFSTANKNDMKHLSEIQRISVPAGALIIWDQRLAHGTQPNNSSRGRLIQFLRLLPLRTISQPRRRQRRAALNRVVKQLAFPLTETAQIVLDL